MCSLIRWHTNMDSDVSKYDQSVLECPVTHSYLRDVSDSRSVLLMSMQMPDCDPEQWTERLGDLMLDMFYFLMGFEWHHMKPWRQCLYPVQARWVAEILSGLDGLVRRGPVPRWRASKLGYICGLMRQLM